MVNLETLLERLLGLLAQLKQHTQPNPKRSATRITAKQIWNHNRALVVAGLFLAQHLRYPQCKSFTLGYMYQVGCALLDNMPPVISQN